MASALQSARALATSAFTGKALRARAPRRVQAVAPGSAVASASRPLWMPGSPAPAHLDGSLPGDFGFDPLHLGEEKSSLSWYVQAELQHARWAMLGVAGILIPDVMTHAGALNVAPWYEAGASKVAFADPFTLFLVQMVLFNFTELKRYYDWKNPGSQSAPGSFLGFEAAFGNGKPGYPGGAFNPLNLAKEPKAFANAQLQEIKNGRLAMVAFLGFCGQAVSTGKGPIDNLLDHLADPFHVTVATNAVALPRVLGF